MTGNNSANYDWFDYLKENMEATTEEIDYLKRLHDLKSKKQISEVRCEADDLPSMIVDDFLYHGEFIHARNIELLKKVDIRHIITVCDFKLKKEIFNKFNVLWVDLHDIPLADISQHFQRTNQFLEMCRSKKEKVLVHCQMGVSRSSSIVLAYLLRYHYDTLYAAYDYLLDRRSIAEPNDGFFLQLIRYEKDLSMNRANGEKQTSVESLNNETVFLVPTA